MNHCIPHKSQEGETRPDTGVPDDKNGLGTPGRSMRCGELQQAGERVGSMLGPIEGARIWFAPGQLTGLHKHPISTAGVVA